MMRLAEYLLTWTGDAQYADYWERNLYNGILAQQHPTTGMIAYFLPLQPGAIKKWGTPTDDFWCCHGTLVQAQTLYTRGVYYQTPHGLALCQYIPTELHWDWRGTPVTVTQKPDTQTGSVHRPDNLTINITVTAAQPVEFALSVRLPWWLQESPIIEVNGARVEVPFKPASFFTLQRNWHNDVIRIVLPKGLSTDSLPDDPMWSPSWMALSSWPGSLTKNGCCMATREIRLRYSSRITSASGRTGYRRIRRMVNRTVCVSCLCMKCATSAIRFISL